MSERLFHSPVAGRFVKVRADGEVYDPDTGEVFPDLTLAGVEFLEDSEDWFEEDLDRYPQWAIQQIGQAV